jgi:hypothetical protein
MEMSENAEGTISVSLTCDLTASSHISSLLDTARSFLAATIRPACSSRHAAVIQPWAFECAGGLARRVKIRRGAGRCWVGGTTCGNGMGAIAVWIPEHVDADLKQEEIAGIFDTPVNGIR